MTGARNRPVKRPRRPDDAPALIEEIEATQEGAQEMAAAWLAVNIDAMLERALLASGMSQADLARTLGITEGRVSQILSSDGNLRVATIGKVFRALGFQAQLQLEPAGDPGKVQVGGRRSDDSRSWREIGTARVLAKIDHAIGASAPTAATQPKTTATPSHALARYKVAGTRAQSAASREVERDRRTMREAISA